MKNEKIEVGHTCGHNSIINTADCKDEEDFKQKLTKAVKTLCTQCYRTIEEHQSDKGKW